jgi:cell pole-organizing protein PopZ
VLELTEALNEDGTVRRLAPIGGSAPYAADSAREPPAAVADPPEQDPRPRPEPEPPRREPTGPSPAATAAVPEDSLVSEVTSLAAAAAFARIAGAPRTHRETPLVGDRPLDEIVQELLRPLLRTWLDENLPQIVERLVQAELARIGRSGTG